jgi:hypothetical protein
MMLCAANLLYISSVLRRIRVDILEKQGYGVFMPKIMVGLDGEGLHSQLICPTVGGESILF